MNRDLEEELKVELSKRIEVSDCKETERLLTKAMLLAISTDNTTKDNHYCIWKEGMNRVDVGPGDIFQYIFDKRRKMRNIIVIPADTRFETNLTLNLAGNPRPLISENTIHGKWLLYMKGKFPENVLKEKIKEGVINFSSHIAPKGEMQYPIGTVSVLDFENTSFFLCAISTLDDNNVAHSDGECIKRALEQLIKVYNQVGQGYPMYLPLLGTGRSRTGLSEKEAYLLHKTAFIENKCLIQGIIHLILTIDCYEKMLKEVF